MGRLGDILSINGIKFELNQVTHLIGTGKWQDDADGEVYDIHMVKYHQWRVENMYMFGQKMGLRP